MVLRYTRWIWSRLVIPATEFGRQEAELYRGVLAPD
jgi:hypothetical protein